jgi:hypothetical protein
MHDRRALATGGAKPGGIGAVSEHDQNSIAAENAAILHTTTAFRTKWIPVRAKKTRQNKNLSFAADSIRTEDALEGETVKGRRDIVPWLMIEK